jgi:MFS family permease
VTFDAPTRRVIVSHTLGALALSLPWPLLLVLVAEQSDDPWLLGLAGAARMLPFVLCSWVGGRLADAMRRDLIVRATLVVRILTLLAAAFAVADGQVWVAVAATTLAVAVATPAYPAVVAAMPGVAGDQYRRATHLLVTIEVGSFVVGAALGGLLLHPATRAVVPWAAVALTALALVLVLPVSMPAPQRQGGPAARVSGLSALRSSPAACRAVAVMAVVNLVDAVAALALLPVALDTWSVGATGYGIATGVLGFSALAAPVLRRLGPVPSRAMRRGLVLAVIGLALLALAPGLAWALVPIAVLGAASVGVEAAATGVLQESVPDEVRATVLGLNDSIIIAAALAGALAAPALVEVIGGRLVFALLGAAALLVAWWARPEAASPSTRPTSPVLVPAALAATR